MPGFSTVVPLSVVRTPGAFTYTPAPVASAAAGGEATAAAAGGEAAAGAAAGMSAGTAVGITLGVATVIVVGSWALGEYLGAWDVDGQKGLFGKTPSKDLANSLDHGVDVVAVGVQHAAHAVAHFFHL